MKLKKTKKKILAAVASALCFAAMMSTSAYASGDVAGAGKALGVPQDRRWFRL